MTPIRPKFGNPPLFEQAIAVVFDALPEFTIGDFGLFWSKIRDEFDACESQAVVEPHIELFDRVPSHTFQVQLVPAEALPRCFYRQRNGSELVQLQADRFGFNWLKHGDGRYPHSEGTLARFFELWAKFLDFCGERGLSAPTVRQCEITNVNIVPVSMVGGMERAHEFFSFVPTSEEPRFLRQEAAGYTSQYRILDDNLQPMGRLYQAFAPAIRADTLEQAFRLELTARGAPAGPQTSDIESFFSLARSAINGAFLAATTKHAQTQWGLADGNGI